MNCIKDIPETCYTDRQKETMCKYFKHYKELHPHIPDSILVYTIKGYMLNPTKFQEWYEHKSIPKSRPRESQEDYYKYAQMNEDELNIYVKNNVHI